MKLRWCAQVVSDLDACTDFYRDVLGLSVKARFSPEPGTEIALLDSGAVEMELVQMEGAPASNPGDAISLGFEVADLNAALVVMKEKGVPIHSGPFIFPGVKYFFIMDPNGAKIELKEMG